LKGSAPKSSIVAVLLAALLANFTPSARAQSLSGRSGTATILTVPNDPWQPRPTVESVSRDAQKAINACDDNVAFQCVAIELARYAEALKQVASERGRESLAVPHRRHAGCWSRHHRPLPCRR
jgi:hypothetical protein